MSIAVSPQSSRNKPIGLDASPEPSRASTARALRAVRRACRAVLGRGNLPDDVTLEQAGCDSLQMMQFARVLEHALGRPVPLDVVDTHMRLDEIVAALSRLPEMEQPGAVRPTVFLLPGLDDDEPRLARFRVGLRHRVNFHLIEYPDWPEMMREGWNFDDLVEAVVKQILDASAGAPILMTGYSFGGEVGFAAACRLVERGANLHWLGILDTDITRVPGPPQDGPLGRLRRYAADIANDPRQGVNKALGLFLSKLARDGIGLPRAHRLGRWWRPFVPAQAEFWFDRRTRSILRILAIWHRMTVPATGWLETPVTLFRSELGLGPSPDHMGWAPRCPNLRIVRVSGDHHTLFDPPHRELLYERYAAEVERVAAQQPAGLQPV